MSRIGYTSHGACQEQRACHRMGNPWSADKDRGSDLSRGPCPEAGVVAVENSSAVYPRGMQIVDGDKTNLCFESRDPIPAVYTFVLGLAASVAEATTQGMPVKTWDASTQAADMSAWLRTQLTPMQPVTVFANDTNQSYSLCVVSGRLRVFWTFGLPFELWGTPLQGTLLLVDGECDVPTASKRSMTGCTSQLQRYEMRGRECIVTVIAQSGQSFCIHKCNVYVVAPHDESIERPRISTPPPVMLMDRVSDADDPLVAAQAHTHAPVYTSAPILSASPATLHPKAGPDVARAVPLPPPRLERPSGALALLEASRKLNPGGVRRAEGTSLSTEGAKGRLIGTALQQAPPIAVPNSSVSRVAKASGVRDVDATVVSVATTELLPSWSQAARERKGK